MIAKYKLIIIPLFTAPAIGLGVYLYPSKQISKEWKHNQELLEDLKLTEGDKDTYSNLKGFSTPSSNTTTRNTTPNSEGNVENGYEYIKRIKDYTVRLEIRNHKSVISGTGWFLDYEIPEAPKQYPTKWFIATNAHVISKFKFEDNLYQQDVNTSPDETEKSLMNRFIIYKEKNNDESILPAREYPEIATDKSKWNNSSLKGVPKIETPWGKRQKTQVDKSYAYSMKQDSQVVFTEIEKPNLFYIPIDFLGTNVPQEQFENPEGRKYLKDFAVLEINFKDEKTAKIVTDDFYNKYKTRPSVNLFAPELTKNKTLQELEKNKEDYFFGGYPGTTYNEYRFFGNYSSQKKKASKLVSEDYQISGARVLNKEGQSIIGHINSDEGVVRNGMEWDKKQINDWGYNYILSGIDLGKGASGSMVISSKGEVLGVINSGGATDNRRGDIFKSNVLVTPLRSEGIFKDGKIIQPRYDLIRGARGQLGSYKEQLDTYFPYLKTRLRNIGWK